MADWEATCQWPASVSGNWQGQPKLAGRLRLCSKSVFFEPEDTRVPIARCAAHSAPLPSVSHKHLAGHAAGAQQSMTGNSASAIRIICMMHYTCIGHLSCMPQCHRPHGTADRPGGRPREEGEARRLPFLRPCSGRSQSASVTLRSRVSGGQNGVEQCRTWDC